MNAVISRFSVAAAAATSSRTPSAGRSGSAAASSASSIVLGTSSPDPSHAHSRYSPPPNNTQASCAPFAWLARTARSLLPSCCLKSEIDHDERRDQQVQRRRRQQPLPAELHQLVIAVARQRPPHPDIEKE